MPARTFVGKYQLIAQLGGGGMADVYLAKSGDGGFQKLAVVKRLKKEGQRDVEVEKMFQDEARLCARLNHPNIVQTFEVGKDAGGPFLVMEYIEGQSFSRLRSRAAKTGQPLARRVGLHVLCEVLSALHYAHTLEDHEGNPLSVIHRDVSPQNVVVTYAGVAKLVDFGVAKHASSEAETRAGTFKGKVAYMAPQQVHAGAKLDGRADVFSAGVILWELLTNQRLWEGVTEVQVLTSLLGTERLPAPRSVDPSVPPELDAICTKAMERDPADRWSSAASMLEALEVACAKLDLRASAREVSLVVTALFKDDREELRGVLSKAASRDESESALPSLVPPDGGMETDSSLELPRIQLGSLRAPKVPSLSTISGAGGVVEVAGVPPRNAGSRRAIYLVAAALAAVAGVAGVVATRPEPAPAIATTRVDPPATPDPPVTPQASASAARAAEEIAIDISASPPSAKIFIDGQPVSGNPHRVRIARESTLHEVRAEAEGYDPKSTSVAFDRDRSLELALAKKSAV
ncbi:MAG: serine/threonine protein kinase, partial [Labilithrix sp.]|nr:serine/threonine protein kinase [Labilithrix sp.]